MMSKHISTDYLREDYIRSYILKNKMFQLILFLLGLAALLRLVYLTNESTGDCTLSVWWGDFVDPAIGVLTFFSALYIAYQNYRKEALDKIELRLTVHYKFEDRFILTCNQAFLSGTSDIRALGQQIGSQMTGVGLLSFFPYQDLETRESYIKDTSGVIFRHYTVTFFLRVLPDPDKKCYFDKNGYTVWFDNDASTNTTDCFLIKNIIQIPITSKDMIEINTFEELLKKSGLVYWSAKQNKDEYLQQLNLHTS